MTTYEQFERIVLRLIQQEHVVVVPMLEVQTEMKTIDGQRENAKLFMKKFPNYKTCFRLRKPVPHQKPFRSYRAFAFDWIRANWNAVLDLEQTILEGSGWVNLPRMMRRAGFKGVNSHVLPTLRRFFLKRNPELQGRIKILHRTISGTVTRA